MRTSVDGTLAQSVKSIEGTLEDRICVPPGAYLLAVAMGTLAFFGVVSAIMLILIALPPLPIWVDSYFLILFTAIYLIMAVLFGFLWPSVSWRWGLWLSLPCILTVILIHLANIADGTGILSTITFSLLIVSVPACAFAFVGQRCAPCEELVSSTKEGFRETVLSEQVITAQAHYMSDERAGQVEKIRIEVDRQREDASIPTSTELSELFQLFQSSETHQGMRS